LEDPVLAADCVKHARMFFYRLGCDLASTAPGSFAISPVAGVAEALCRDYDNTVAMVFGTAPTFDQMLASMTALDTAINRVAP